MRTLTFSGHSDDIFTVVDSEGFFTEEYYHEPRIAIRNPLGGMIVQAIYGSNGCWGMNISPLDEDILIPWDVKVELDENGYSTKLVVSIPGDPDILQVENLGAEEDEDY